jgi:predicted aldo/keto reductase-like oxidoreductase
MQITRSEFIRLTSATLAGLSFGVPILSTGKTGGLPYRTLGKTGLEVSLLTVGGWSIGNREELTEKESIRLMRTAIDEGINFFDNAWDYHDGRSEKWMGKALRDGYRQKVILMTKHHGREPMRARQHLEDSLKRLRTDVIDVWQFHELDEQQEVESIYSSGVLEIALKAKEEGKIRFIGFTGHYRPAIHLDMINRGFDWDTVQLPINVLDHHFLSFSQQVLPIAVEKGMGVIGMKSLAGGAIPGDNLVPVEDCLRFAMTLPISTLCSGMDSIKVLRENIATARNFVPMTEDEMAMKSIKPMNRIRRTTGKRILTPMRFSLRGK